MSRQEALQLAAQQDLDLVEISPDARPPVAKIVDWGKFQYQRTKQQQKNKRNNKVQDIKQMRLGLKIGDHDLEIKMKKVRQFLDNSHKAKITIFFRGREMAHKDMGFKLAERIIDSFGDTIIIDQQPQLNGKQLIFVIRAGHVAKPSDKSTEEKPTDINKAPSIKGLDKIQEQE